MSGAQCLLILGALICLCVAFYSQERANRAADRELEDIAPNAHGSGDWEFPDRLDN